MPQLCVCVQCRVIITHVVLCCVSVCVSWVLFIFFIYLFYVFQLEKISHSNIAYFVVVVLMLCWKSTPNLFFRCVCVHTWNVHLLSKRELKTKERESTRWGRIFVYIKCTKKKSIKCHPALKFEMSTLNLSSAPERERVRRVFGKPIQIIIRLYAVCVLLCHHEILCARG